MIILYLDMALVEDAIKIYETAIKMDPHDAIFFFLRLINRNSSFIVKYNIRNFINLCCIYNKGILYNILILKLIKVLILNIMTYEFMKLLIYYKMNYLFYIILNLFSNKYRNGLFYIIYLISLR